MTLQTKDLGRTKELVTALANNPWVEHSVRETCRLLMNKWRVEDERAVGETLEGKGNG